MENGTVTLMEEKITPKVDVTEETMRDEGFLDEEIDLAIKHNIIKKGQKDGEHDGKQPDAAKKDDPKVDQSKIDLESLDSFEKVHEIYEKHPDKFRQLPTNVKALYHNSKGLYKKAKVEEQKRIDVEKKFEYDSLKQKAAEIKLGRVREALKKDNLTVEDIESILGDGVQEKKAEEVKEPEVDRTQMIQMRIAEVDKLGRVEHEDFDRLVALAQQVVQAKPRQLRLLQDALNDDATSEKEIVDLVVDIARLHNDFEKKAEKEQPVKAQIDEKVDRMVKNSQKKPTSASIGGGTGSRTKSFDEITPEDVARMSLEEYKKLPEPVRRRLKEELI